MPHNRFFLNTPLCHTSEISLEDEEARHLQVMRKKEGDSVEIINGKNQLGTAIIVKNEKKRVILKIEKIEERVPVDFKTIICQALCRGSNLDMIVEKGTELGMTEIWLFPGEQSEKKELSAHQLQRLEAIAISAIKQCGRLDLPKILLKPPLIKWEQIPYSAFYGTLSDTAPPFLSIWQKKEHGILFFIGPEKGFTQKEEALLEQLGAKGVSLHPNILRAETAPLVALSLISLQA